jgi:hypothetical protein
VTTRKRLGDVLGLVFVLAITLAARLIPAVSCGVEIADLSMYRQMALVVMRQQDIYDMPGLYHYTPLSLFIPSFCLQVSERTGLTFDIVIKLFPIAADLGIATLLFLLARQRWGVWKATLAGLAYALNPVSVLITGFHGQLMPLSVFFAFWAFYLRHTDERYPAYVLSALSLGVAIALRGWPVLLVPFLIRRQQWRHAGIYIVLAALPSVVTLAPYAAVSFAGIRREIFNYQSTPDFGWMGVWRGVWYLVSANEDLPGDAGPAWLSRSRFIFLAGYAALLGLWFLKPYAVRTAEWIAAALLLNYTLVGGLAAQYYGWVLPFLVFHPYYEAAFALAAGGALVTFYLTWFPAILTGPHTLPFAYTRPVIVTWNVGFLALTWLVGVAGVLWILPRWWSVRGNGRSDRTEHRLEWPKPLATAQPGSDRWLILAIGVLSLGVVATLGMELSYLRHARPAPELSARVLWKTGKRGSEPGAFDAPMAVAVHPSGDILVADMGNARVERFNSRGEFIGLWKAGTGNSPPFVAPTALAISANGETFVLDAERGAVDLLPWDDSPAVSTGFALPATYVPRGLALDETRGRFYVADTGHGRVLLLGRDGHQIADWGDGRLELAWSVGLDHRGNLFLLEHTPSRVRKITPDNVTVAQWRVQGEVSDLAVGPDDRVYITAADRPGMWVFDNDGKVVGQVLELLKAADLGPSRGIAVQAPGEVIVATEGAMVRLSVELPRRSDHRSAPGRSNQDEAGRH